MADVFISYSRDDREAVATIASQLLSVGLSVWFDADLTSGSTFGDEIDREIHAAKAMLVCWSSASRASKWVKAEATIGFEHDKLAACFVGGERPTIPAPFNTIHTEDLGQWTASPDEDAQSWRSVLRRIGSLCGRRDIESWATLSARASIDDVRDWLARYGQSPLFFRVESLLRTREAEEQQRLERERAARERFLREQAERERELARAEAVRLEEERLALERAEAERIEEERQWYEAERWKSAEKMRREAQRQKTQSRIWTGAIALMVVAVGWAGTSAFLRERARVEACRTALAAAPARREAYQLEADSFAGLGRGESQELHILNGETLEELLLRAGVTERDTQSALAAIGRVYNTRRIRPGQPVTLSFMREAEARSLSGVAFRSEPGASVTANRLSSGEFTAREVQMPLIFEIARIEGPVQTGIYSGALRAGATDREVAALYDAFSNRAGLVEQLRPTDRFELVFERFYDDEGNTVRTGDLLYVSLRSARGTDELYQFMAPGDSRPDWYNPQGVSARIIPETQRPRSLRGRALELFTIERERVNTLRQVRQREREAAPTQAQTTPERRAC